MNELTTKKNESMNKLLSIVAVSAAVALGAKADPVIVNNYIQVPPSVVVAPPAPVVAPAPVTVPTPPVETSHAWDFIMNVWTHFSNYDSEWLTDLTQNGETNYFGHLHASNSFICNDMGRDSGRYSQWHADYYPESFTHEVSDQYSSRWEGPMIYDNITMVSNVYEIGVRWHHATIKFTVGYTYVNGIVKIYALVYKVV
jgi:hypothetical protein